MKIQMRGVLAGAAAVLGLAVVTSSASAQAQTSGTRFGVEGAFGLNDNVGIGVGAFVKFHLADLSEHPITGRASFDYFFPGSSFCGGFDGCGVHYFKVALDGLYDIANAKSNVKPYVGAGLELTRYTFGDSYCGDGFYDGSCSYSNFGLDLVGGINFAGNSKLMPFVELNLGAGSGSEFLVKAGIHF
ncbi:MAG TPA: hypothetical protein VGM77_04640 [Gemmatimonadales bacterium]|jgi:hypothetical protein